MARSFPEAGRSIIALHSTTNDGSASKNRTHADDRRAGHDQPVRCQLYRATEYGVAQLRGQTLRERARRLITIAHPSFREQLAAEYEQRFGEKLPLSPV